MSKFETVAYPPDVARKLRDGVHVPYSAWCAYTSIEKGNTPEEQLELGKVALVTIQGMIDESKSQAEALLLRNAVFHPLCARLSQLSEEVREAIPKAHVSYAEAQEVVSELLRGAIRKRTKKDHTRVNDLRDPEDPTKPIDEVDLVTGCLLRAQGEGHPSHGFSVRAVPYAEQILEGPNRGINTNGKFEIVDENPAKMLFRGHKTFGQVAMQRGFDYVAEMLNEEDEFSISVDGGDMYHAGRLAEILRQAARKGLKGIAMFNVRGWGRCGPPNAERALYGTNPIGGCMPIGIGKEGFVADTATVVMPEGGVREARDLRLVLPGGVLISPADGSITIDPNALYDGDALLTATGYPLSEHRGAALAEMIELMVPDVCARYNRRRSDIPVGSNNVHMSFTKVDAGTMRENNRALQRMRRCKSWQGGNVRIAGDQGLISLAKARKDGFEVPEETWDKITQMHRELCAV